MICKHPPVCGGTISEQIELSLLLILNLRGLDVPLSLQTCKRGLGGGICGRPGGHFILLEQIHQ